MPVVVTTGWRFAIELRSGIFDRRWWEKSVPMTYTLARRHALQRAREGYKVRLIAPDGEYTEIKHVPCCSVHESIQLDFWQRARN